MAEIPEVETLVRDLERAVLGAWIEQATVLTPEIIRFTDPETFQAEIRGHQIREVQRRAKFVLIDLYPPLILALHFMLHGTLRLRQTAAPLEKFVHIIFKLDRGDDIRLIDDLGYSRVALLPPEEVVRRLGLDKLGPEALDPSFTPQMLASLLRKHRGVLKAVLVDQHVFAGLGNRDADESLWLAGIAPDRSASSLSEAEIQRLYDAMLSTIRGGIEHRGTLVDLFGVPGTQWHYVQIFEKTGKPCPRCRTPIQRVRLGGKNTHFCSVCQR